MGDTSNTSTDQDSEKNSPQEPLNALHQSKSSENIAVLSKSPLFSKEVLEKIHDAATFQEKDKNVSDSKSKEIDQKKEPDTTKTEDNLGGDQEQSVSDNTKIKNIEQPLPTTIERKLRAGSAASGLNQSERIPRNQSDIFSLKEQTSVASSIFSINGSPSRKVFRKKELIASTVIPFGQVSTEPPSDKVSPRDRMRDRDSYNDIKRPTSSLRNPLTGTGLSSNDEYNKSRMTKRKDGNPLLGLGYSPEVAPSTHRIPPGGYSHKLW
ncbi:uncharacterized protein [Leptinotarsa decemlineata]|uniref:uncharacterized protein n=1 Tax=Leptinotarsa decemlineata TaxID=7539 RepID=UPI003D30798B